jgi:hypothetical protein
MVLSYILRRLVQMIPTFLGATLLAFLIIQAAPGDFTDRFALDPNIDPEQLQRMRERFALDQPVLVQYANWMWSIIRFGYLGESFSYRAAVNDVIYPLVINSMSLVLVSLVDITARKKAEAYLEYLGKHDSLTRLYNRREFEERARAEGDAMIERARKDIERQKNAALNELREESVDLALAAATRLLQRKLDAEADRALIRGFIADISSPKAGVQA